MHAQLENLTLKAVARQMPEAVVLADRQGRITWVNPAFEKLCGYKLREVKGENPGRILQGKDTDPMTVKSLRLAVEEGLAIREDILNYHKEGYSYWARVSITPLRKANDELQGFIAIERDVTEEHEHVKELHGEVVELYAALLYEESPKSKLKPDDPFYRPNKRK